MRSAPAPPTSPSAATSPTPRPPYAPAASRSAAAVAPPSPAHTPPAPPRPGFPGRSPRRDLRARAQPELAQDVAHVPVRRPLGYHQPQRNLAIGQPFGDQPRNLPLPLRK